MNCPKCRSKRYCKFGRKGKGEHERQRYKCAQCAYVYTVSRLSKPGDRNWAYPLAKRKKAIKLFEGPVPRTLQQIADKVGGGVTKATVHRWMTDHRFVQQLLLSKSSPTPIEKPAPPLESDAGRVK